MNSTRPVGTTVALIVTVLYGLSIAVLAVLDVGNIGVIAAVGAILVGAVWVVTTLLRGGGRKAQS